MSDETSSSSSPTTSDGSLYPEIPRNAVQIAEQLGVGTFGSVYKGLWTQHNSVIKEVAMKKVFMLQKEAEILSKIRHRNIIEFYGICKTGSDFYIVTEYAESGSLYDHLHHDENMEIDFDTVLRWAREIAAGIYYLHYDAVVTIIHRDLKSKNVVVDSKQRCKICDFGTSKDLTHSCTAPTWGGTAAWMSPEIINQNEGLTTASDVWSYGVVLWEMLSREIPYKDFTEFRIYTLITQTGVNLVIPDSCPPSLANLMRGCWKMVPKERLTMKKIVIELSAMEKCPQTKQECQIFLGKEDWKRDIEIQKKELDKQRKILEKQKEKLNKEQKAFLRRVRHETALLDAVGDPPADVSLWNEQHTMTWIGRMLKTDDLKLLDKVKQAICRHRITGARLLEMTQKDFESLGVNKLGCRMELMKGVRGLKAAHSKFVDFPTLEQAQRLSISVKPKEDFPNPLLGGMPLVLLLGYYPRPGATTTRLKFYVDVDWDDDEPSTSSAPSSFIKSVCFTVLDDDMNKPLNEPACYSGYSNFAMEWVTKPDDVDRIRVIANIHYSDNVSEPRSTELVAVLTTFDRPSNIIERRVRVRTGRRSSITPNSSSLIHSAVSSPFLRGVWQKKAKETRETLLDSGIASLNPAFSDISHQPSFFLEDGVKDQKEQKDTPTVRKKRRHRKRTESENLEHTENPRRKEEVHGGKPKWAWKSQQSRNLQ